MRPIKIVVDSTCDLPKDFLEKHDVTTLPLLVVFNEKSYRDGLDITVEELYQKVKENKALPKTSALPVAVFEEEFKKWVDAGYDVLCIVISSGFSSTLQNAYIASQQFEGHVVAFDSQNLSSGIGLLICKAIELKEKGASLGEIVERLNYYVPRVRSQFAVETLEYLHKGGRCSSLVYLFGKGLHIRPIIRVKDGKMFVYKKPRGKMVKALDELMTIFKNDLENIELDRVMLTHSIAPESEAYLKQELLKIIPEDKLMITNAGSIISSHCGRGTIGILYILKEIK